MPIQMIKSYPHFLWFLTLSFSMTIILANWFAPRLVHFWGIDTDGGTFIFPLTFILSDLITEVYGYKQARRAIWCGFLFNSLFVLYGQLITAMPSPDFPTNNDMFDTIISFSPRIVCASLISYFFAEPLNSYIMAKLKIKMAGKLVALRFFISTVFAAGLDSFLFLLIAFYGVIGNENLLPLILTMWGIKVVIEIAVLPVTTYLAKWLKQQEQLDIYDFNTNFVPFSLNGEYALQNNLYAAYPK